MTDIADRAGLMRRRPVGAFLMLFLLLYTSNAWIWPASSALDDTSGKPLSFILHGIFAVGIAFAVTIGQGKTISSLWSVPGQTIFLIYCLVSITWSDNPEAGSFAVWVVGAWIIGGYVAWSISFLECIALCVLWTFFVIFLSLLLYFLAPELGQMPTYDAGLRGLFDHKNIFGGVVMSMTPFLFYQLSFGKLRKKRALALAALLLGMIGLYLSGSGGATLAMIVIAVLWIFGLFGLPQFPGRALPFLVALLVCGSTWFVFAIGTGFIAELMGRSATLTGRTDIWSLVLTYRPPTFLGNGLGSLSPTSEPMLVVQAILRQPLRSAHSMYVQTLSEVGFCGLSIYLAVLLSGLALAFSATDNVAVRRINLLISVVAFSILVYGFVETRSGVRMNLGGTLLPMLMVWRIRLTRTMWEGSSQSVSSDTHWIPPKTIVAPSD